MRTHPDKIGNGAEYPSAPGRELLVPMAGSFRSAHPDRWAGFRQRHVFGEFAGPLTRRVQPFCAKAHLLSLVSRLRPPIVIGMGRAGSASALCKRVAADLRIRGDSTAGRKDSTRPAGLAPNSLTAIFTGRADADGTSRPTQRSSRAAITASANDPGMDESARRTSSRMTSSCFGPPIPRVQSIRQGRQRKAQRPKWSPARAHD
jgi:hypothetical protein